MNVDVFVVLLVMVIGCAALVFGIVYLICRVLGTAGRSLFGAFRRGVSGGRRTGHVGGSQGVVCPRAACRNVDVRDARFCSQCGTELRH